MSETTLKDRLFPELDLDLTHVDDSAALERLIAIVDPATSIAGTPARDRLSGTTGNDVLLGDAESDSLLGRSGNDVYIGGSGSDKLSEVTTDLDDDHFLYQRSVNSGARDYVYGSGNGANGDTLWLVLTHDEYQAYKSEIDSVQKWLSTHDSVDYSFQSFGLSINNIEHVEVLLSSIAPTATDDVARTEADTPITTGNVLANDHDPDVFDTLTITAYDAVSANGATIHSNGDGTFDYDPNGQFATLTTGETSEDHFSYTISDLAGLTSTATVTVTIDGVGEVSVNHAPALTGTPATLPDGIEDTPYIINAAALLEGWTDADGDPLSVVNLTANQGTLTNNGNGTYTLTPPLNASGDIMLTYQVSDGTTLIDTTRSFALAAVNDAPTISGIPAEAQAVTVGTVADLADITVADVDSDTLTLTLTATNGTIGSLTDADPAEPGIQLTGTAATINATLKNATFTAAASGPASITFAVKDDANAIAPRIYNLNAAAAATPLPAVLDDFVKPDDTNGGYKVDAIALMGRILASNPGLPAFASGLVTNLGQTIFGNTLLGADSFEVTTAGDYYDIVSLPIDAEGKIRLTFIIDDFNNTVSLGYSINKLLLKNIINNVNFFEASLFDGVGLSEIEFLLTPVSVDTGEFTVGGNTLDLAADMPGVTMYGALDLKDSTNDIFQFLSTYFGVHQLSASLNINPNKTAGSLITLEQSIDGALRLIDFPALEQALGIDLGQLGEFAVSLTNRTATLEIGFEGEPEVTGSQTITLNGYDPTQSNEPALDLIGTFGIEPFDAAFSITGEVATQDIGWTDPFGFGNDVIFNRLAVKVGATPKLPFFDSFGLILDFASKSYDINLGLAFDITDPDETAFSLTLRNKVSIPQMFAQLAVLPPALSGDPLSLLASGLIAAAGPLFKYIPATITSIDGADADTEVDPLINFALTSTDIGSQTIPAGMGINGQVEIAGQTGSLTLATNDTFTALNGELIIETLKVGNWLELSSGKDENQDGTPDDLKLGLSISTDDPSMSGDAKFMLFGQTLAEAHYSISPTEIHISDTRLPLGLLSLKIDSLNASLDNLSLASGSADISFFDRFEIAKTQFTFTSQSITFSGDIDFGLLNIDGDFEFMLNTLKLTAIGTVTINGTELSNSTIYTDEDHNLIAHGTTTISLSEIGLGNVFVGITAKLGAGDLVPSFHASANLGAFGIYDTVFDATEINSLADQIANYVTTGIGLVASWVEEAAQTAGVSVIDFLKDSVAFTETTVTKIINDLGLSAIFDFAASTFEDVLDFLGLHHDDPKSIMVIGTESDEIIRGGTVNDVLFGNGGNDTIFGDSGWDKIDGGAGDDSLSGGDGDDEIYGGEGNDSINASSGENWLMGGGGDDAIVGGSGDDVLSGGFGNDILRGMGGSDYLQGDAGNDVLYPSFSIDPNADITPEIVSILEEFHSTQDNIMYGGSGDDIYYIGYGGGDTGKPVDMVSECIPGTDDDAGGVDTVYSLADAYTLPNYVENLTLLGVSKDFAQIGNGNELDNHLSAGSNILVFFSGRGGNDIITGGPQDDHLYGGDGDDAIYGKDGSDLLNGGNGNDIIYGEDGGDSLNGGNGNDILDGGADADVLEGGSGNDAYYVDNINDVVSETYSYYTFVIDKLTKVFVDYGGIDTVYSSIDFNLADYFENLTLTGISNINATGNSLNNILTGNSGINVLTGGAGNDTYYANYTGVNSGDQIIENAGEGIDTIYFVSNKGGWYGNQLPDNVENLNLIESAVYGRGNSLDNALIGNATLGGGYLYGAGGNDTYYVFTTDTAIYEYAGGGMDTVYSSVTYTLSNSSDAYVENLTLTGTANINATGNSLNNILTGNNGSNVLAGGGGNDVLTGGGGADFFVFDTLSTTAVVTITDFLAADDRLVLKRDVFSGLSHTGTLDASAFCANTTGLAQEADDRIIYDTDDGKLYYDQDGAGTQYNPMAFAIIGVNIPLTAGDFQVV